MTATNIKPIAVTQKIAEFIAETASEALMVDYATAIDEPYRSYASYVHQAFVAAEIKWPFFTRQIRAYYTETQPKVKSSDGRNHWVNVTCAPYPQFRNQMR